MVNLIPVLIPIILLGILWATYSVEAHFHASRQKRREEKRNKERLEESERDRTRAEESEEVNRAYREEEKRRFLGSVAKVNELMAEK